MDRKRRRSVKDWTPNSLERVRNDCFRRTNERREEWKARWRQSEDKQCERDAISSELRCMVKEELSQENNVMLQDPIPDTPLSTGPLDGSEQEVEYERALQQFENELVANLWHHLMEQEQEEDDRVSGEEYLDAMANEEASTGSAHQARVLCPVCRQSYLQKHGGFIFCPKEQFALDLQAEGTSLEELRQRLEGAYADHGHRSCAGQLRFYVDGSLGVNTLCTTCDVCHMLEVIV